MTPAEDTALTAVELVLDVADDDESDQRQQERVLDHVLGGLAPAITGLLYTVMPSPGWAVPLILIEAILATDRRDD